MRVYRPSDKLIDTLGQAMKTLSGAVTAARESPGKGFSDDGLPEDQKKLSVRLMRINHAGEVAAQGLYHGQALTARSDAVAEHMQQNAHEESDHLAWCRERIDQLHGRSSLLTPLWYLGALTIGAATGLAGDHRSFGFVKETEDQVVEHLESHLARTPSQDTATIAIIEQIRRDEAEHAQAARAAGATELPQPVRLLMRAAAKMMTTTAAYL